MQSCKALHYSWPPTATPAAPVPSVRRNASPLIRWTSARPRICPCYEDEDQASGLVNASRAAPHTCE